MVGRKRGVLETASSGLESQPGHSPMVRPQASYWSPPEMGVVTYLLRVHMRMTWVNAHGVLVYCPTHDKCSANLVNNSKMKNQNKVSHFLECLFYFMTTSEQGPCGFHWDIPHPLQGLARVRYLAVACLELSWDLPTHTQHPDFVSRNGPVPVQLPHVF